MQKEEDQYIENCMVVKPLPVKMLADMFERTNPGKKRQLLMTMANNRTLQELFGTMSVIEQCTNQEDKTYTAQWADCVTALQTPCM